MTKQDGIIGEDNEKGQLNINEDPDIVMIKEFVKDPKKMARLTAFIQKWIDGKEW